MFGRRTSGTSRPSLGAQVLVVFSFIPWGKSHFKKCLGKRLEVPDILLPDIRGLLTCLPMLCFQEGPDTLTFRRARVRFKKARVPPSKLRDGPTTTTTIFEFISRRPICRFLHVATNAPSTQWNTQKRQRCFIWSFWCVIKCRFDVTSDAKRLFESYGCGCGWAVPDTRADFREGDEDSNFQFSESGGSLNGPDLFTELPFLWKKILTKPLIHWIASPLLTEKPFFISLKSASSHPLPKNRLWW